MKISYGLAKGRVPIPVIDDLWPADCIRYLARERRLKSPLKLLPWHRLMLAREGQMWDTFYVPKGGLTGATVLDAGAGCGETAQFFFNRGASEVVAVEKDRAAFDCFTMNALLNHWNSVAINESFKLAHLNLRDFDFVKIDIEGGEACLLGLDSLPRGIVELHGREMRKRFMARFARYDYDPFPLSENLKHDMVSYVRIP